MNKEDTEMAIASAWCECGNLTGATCTKTNSGFNKSNNFSGNGILRCANCAERLSEHTGLRCNVPQEPRTGARR